MTLREYLNEGDNYERFLEFVRAGISPVHVLVYHTIANEYELLRAQDVLKGRAQEILAKRHFYTTRNIRKALKFMHREV